MENTTKNIFSCQTLKVENRYNNYICTVWKINIIISFMDMRYVLINDNDFLQNDVINIGPLFLLIHFSRL